MTATHYTIAVYAALLALLFFGLSVRTILNRRKFQVGIGDGGKPQMMRAIRVHANFAEYIPLCLFLIFLLEVQGASSTLIHGLGVALLLGRLLHAYGLSQENEKIIFRQLGMAMTFSVLLTSAITIILLMR